MSNAFEVVETCNLLCLYLSDFGFQNVRHVLDNNYWKIESPDLKRHLIYGTYIDSVIAGTTMLTKDTRKFK